MKPRLTPFPNEPGIALGSPTFFAALSVQQKSPVHRLKGQLDLALDAPGRFNVGGQLLIETDVYKRQ